MALFDITSKLCSLGQKIPSTGRVAIQALRSQTCSSFCVHFSLPSPTATVTAATQPLTTSWFLWGNVPPFFRPCPPRTPFCNGSNNEPIGPSPQASPPPPTTPLLFYKSTNTRYQLTPFLRCNTSIVSCASLTNARPPNGTTHDC